MAAEAKALDVKVLDREFRVTCTDDEQPALLRAVDYLDRKMRDIRDTGKVVGVERIAVMAALNIAHELLSAPRGSAVGGLDSAEVARKLQALQAAVDAALVAQDDLFQ
jgi:cell division protein ZapA